MEKSFSTFVEAVADGEDPYVVAASQIFQIPLLEITKSQRNETKTRLMGAIYGYTDHSLSQQKCFDITFSGDVMKMIVAIENIKEKM